MAVKESNQLMLFLSGLVLKTIEGFYISDLEEEYSKDLKSTDSVNATAKPEPAEFQPIESANLTLLVLILLVVVFFALIGGAIVICRMACRNRDEYHVEPALINRRNGRSYVTGEKA